MPDHPMLGHDASPEGAEQIALIDLLQALVRIPSPNPPGDTRAIAAHIAERLNRPGVSAHSSVSVLAPDAKPEAASVVARVGAGDPVILLHAHLDTVPVAEDEATHWRVDPYSAAIHDGRLYGKGSVDDKAPLAAMIQTYWRAAEWAAAGQLRGTLALVAAAEEEVGGQLGTRWLAENGHLPASDFIIVGEQTANRVATAHKGVLRATVRVTGRSVHATNPDRGVNAITAMAQVVLALQAYHDSLRSRVHPLAGTPTCNVGTIRGGSTANAVPDVCVAQIDRRMIPREDPNRVQAELTQVIAQAAAQIAPAQVSIGDFLISDWFDSTVESPLAREFLRCVADVLSADPGPIGYLPGSDAKHLKPVARGEMVIFGPGSYEVAHAYDEYVDLSELDATARILLRFAEATLRVSP